MGLYLNSLSGNLALAKSLYQASEAKVNIMKRLSSGIRINSASDDAANLSLSQKLTSVINGNTTAKNNSLTGISYLDTADSALNNMSNSLQKIRNIAIQSLNGVYSSSERQMLQKEVTQLSSDINQTYKSAKFSGQNVFMNSSTTATTISSHMTESAAISAGYSEANIIRNASDFVNKITGHESENFILMGDLDLSSLGTLSQALFQNQYSGTLDGNGYSISNMTIKSNGANINCGLFAHLNGATVKNLTLANCNVNDSTNSAGIFSDSGILAGEIENSTITKVNVSGGSVIGGTGDAGSLAGWSIYSTFIDCGSSANISNGQHVGSFVGHSTADSFDNCYASGDAVASSTTGVAAGGFLGVMDSGAIISNCYATGNVRNPLGYAAGLVGIVGYDGSWLGGGGDGFISNSYAAGGNISGNIIRGLAGKVVAGSDVDATNFYKNNASSDGDSSVNANISAAPTSGWSSTIWDKSVSIPQLKWTEVSPSLSEGSVKIQVGDDEKSTSSIDLYINFDIGPLNFDVSNQGSSESAIKQADQLMLFLNTMRSNVGASMNKLQSTVQALVVRTNNLSESKSTIYDADMAIESANLIKNQIRSQTGVQMLQQIKDFDRPMIMKLLNSL